MRPILALLLAASVASPALARPAAPESPPSDTQRYDTAPWWMNKPVIASMGYVETELEANRASFSASYQAVDRDAAVATKAAADKVRQLGKVLSAFGADKVRVSTTFTTTPLYEQYRDKNGEMQTNARADKIDNYQVTASVAVEVRDVRVAEEVYATLLSAHPTSASRVSFYLVPDDATKREMYRLAVADAAKRAQLAAEAAGTRVGAVRVIDPTGRACQTDILLAGAPRGYGVYGAPTVVGGVPMPPPPPPAPAMRAQAVQKVAVEAQLRPEDYQLPLQPPQQTLNGQACVVFSLG